MNSLGLVCLYWDHVWKLHGLPNMVISDHGPQFVLGFMRELNKILWINTRLSTTYHPQTDGQTERMNQELEQYLRMFMDYCQMNWLEWLAIAKFSYNNKIQKSIKISPFYANYGFNPRMGFKPWRDVKVQAVDKFVDELKNIQEEAGAALHKACDDMKHFADWTRVHALEYKEGDQVWLSTKNLNINQPLKKINCEANWAIYYHTCCITQCRCSKITAII